jgi:universal stress protein E
MSFFDRIVVGVDYTPDESAAVAAKAVHIQRAFQLAHSSQRPIVAVAVLPEAKSGWFESIDEAQIRVQEDESEAKVWLQNVVQHLVGGGDDAATVEIVVAVGTGWMEIMRVAANDNRALIVCGTRRKSSLSRVLFGSTGMKLLRYAVGPVWLVHPNPDEDDRLDILATSDLTDVGLHVIEAAVSLAQLLPSRLSAITIAETDTERRIARSGADETTRETIYAKAREECELRLQQQINQTDYRTLESGVKTLSVTGNADVAILQAVDNLKTNLVVMATRARGGVAGMVLGNTAERLFTTLPCSVLVIKPDDFQCPVDLD